MTPVLTSRSAWRAGFIMSAGLVAAPAWAQTLGTAGSSPELPLWRVVGALLFCCVLGAAGALALRYRLRNGPRPGPRVSGRPGVRLVDDQTVGRLMNVLGLKPAKAGETAPSRLQVVETVRLSYQVEVSLLECDGATVMIVTSPQGAFVVNREAPDRTGGQP